MVAKLSVPLPGLVPVPGSHFQDCPGDSALETDRVPDRGLDWNFNQTVPLPAGRPGPGLPGLTPEQEANMAIPVNAVLLRLLNAPVPDPVPGLPVGRRLSRCSHHWREVIDDPWTNSIVQDRFRIPLKAPPPLVFSPSVTRSEPVGEKADAVLREVTALVSKGAIKPLEIPVPCPGFYSYVFLV